MKKTKLFGSFILVLFILFSCQKNQEIGQEVYPEKINYLKTSAQCTTPLIAGQSMNIGDVTVTYLNASNIVIDYQITDINWCLTETHLDVQLDPANFPQTGSGNPKVGHFAYGQTLGCVSSWSQTINLNTFPDWTEGDVLYIAAHANVRDQSLIEETAWGEGDPFPGNNWAMYFHAGFLCGDPLVDTRDGQTYSTVEIGTQCWMAENLNYNAGNGSWVYGNNPANAEIYGRLYNWETANNVCPTGWHLPNDAEWTVLSSYLGGDAGGKMKETGTIHWSSPNTGATNESGFTALPGGYYESNGNFYWLGGIGHWWSATEYNSTGAWGRYLYYNRDGLRRNDGDKVYGFSVRCIKD